ncbi:RNA 3'-terminal phosphate cyclase [Microbulbifer taiwanensis]|uniref:RNA 3'-terminal phosphate cyclase n=1 Tax=Microbulbifer taiwanensis TaxID=986746 RepID=UPI0018693871|nr:RNA 3'-terminal phosphate cyclase [Microbulbifer taiwanensis]
MLVIDGSQGEGGGQIFRTSLTLSMCLQKPVRIKNIRAGRSKPGLLRQHLACLRAGQAICGAEISGDELGSTEVIFKPGRVVPGEYRFAIGSAGSTSLVFQTVLLPLLLSDGVSEVCLEGGTHNGHAPSFDFIEKSFLPLMAQLGYRAEIELERYGFYPAGGGQWRALIQPVQELKPLDLTSRGALLATEAVVTSAQIPGHIAKRELQQIRKRCHWPEEVLHRRQVESAGPGNIVSLRAFSEQITEVAEVVGEKQLSAERVAGRAAKAMKRYLEADVPVGEHLADQILLPMVLGKGGRFTTLEPSLHLQTNIEVIRQLTGVEVALTKESDFVWSVTTHPNSPLSPLGERVRERGGLIEALFPAGGTGAFSKH